MAISKRLSGVLLVFALLILFSSGVRAEGKNCAMKDSTMECKNSASHHDKDAPGDTASCKKSEMKASCCEKHEHHGKGMMKSDSCKNECPMMGDRKKGHVPAAVDTAVVQKNCPVTGEPIDKSVYLDYQGNRVYFCCESCKAEFLKSPEKYLKK